MTGAQQFLSADPTICHYAQQAWCEQGCHPHRTIYITYLFPREMKGDEHISSHRDQPGSPNEKFQKIHENETELNTHYVVILVYDPGLRSWKINKYPTIRNFTP